MAGIHRAYHSGGVLYLYVCRDLPATACLHGDDVTPAHEFHRHYNYPSHTPETFAGEQADWERYCARDALWRDDAAEAATSLARHVNPADLVRDDR